jgi:DNA-directed RNA polymerase specialized sigma24 family protein
MMLDCFSSVERALTRYTDPLQPRSGSVSVVPSTKPSGDRFPFHPALLDGLEERTELRRRMAWLGAEEATVLVRWYIEGARPEKIAGDLGRSVRHVYRYRVAGIERLVSLGRADEFEDADLAEFV